MLARSALRRTVGSLLAGMLVPLVLSACISKDPGSAPAACETYCTEIAKTCGGPNLQYRTPDECMKACATIEPGSESDGNVNSIGCRLRMARSAKTLTDCVSAGPFGGGVCGTRCGAFCAMIGKTCLDIASPPFGGSAGTCNEVCPNFAFDPVEGEGPNQKAFTGKDTINCRSHHLILALTDKIPHCSHADVKSVNCVP